MNEASEDIDYSQLPERLSGGLRRYFEGRIATGDFLRAVLENDLREAIARADYLNQPLLPVIVIWLNMYAPADSWGSREKVAAWLKREEGAES